MSRQEKGLIDQVVALFGSYGLACVCLFLLFVLTILGTLHQVDHGLYDAKQTFFNSWFLWTEVGGTHIPWFPGGVASMGLLTLNLIVGGILRIRWQWRNIGVIIIHFGIVFMMLAGLVKMTNSEEGHLTLWEIDRPSTSWADHRSDHFQSYTDWEVAIWEADGAPQATERIIPNDHLVDLEEDGQRTFHHPDLPFELTLKGFVPNCDVMPKGPQWEATGEVIEGFGILTLPEEKEAERNIAGIHAEVAVGGEVQRAILYGAQRLPWVFEAGGKTWAVDLRHTRHPMPYEIRLEKFVKEDHPGISMAKAYRSEVSRIDATGIERVLIQMNEPLREGGLVLFQTNWGPQQGVTKGPWYSVFTVVRNPSDKWPEYAMWVITLGLVIAFGRTLNRFVRKQLDERNRLATTES